MLLIILLCLALALGFVFLLPFKGARTFRYQPPNQRVHESDAVLSRRLLKPGTPEYHAFYQKNPGLRETDDRSRKAPGLLSQKAKYYDPGTFAAATSNFEIIEFLGALTHGPDAATDLGKGTAEKSQVRTDPGQASQFIHSWLRKTGAHQVGFARLQDYHLYSHKGRGKHSGEAIEKLHSRAIAITVEMDHRMMQSAPLGSSVMESSEQYLRSGILALKLAAWIRELGYEATAHIDGNYEVICPLVAVDAGLGTIGRMGLLMTPDLGPRVRISVVTTNLPLPVNKQTPDPGTLHFCHHCQKCVRNCPAAAIPEGPRTEIGGVDRWKINSERCYHFWTTSGTDCGRCITVCPYSHPDNAFHRFIRWGIKNNLVFRRLAIKLDDVFYGPKPAVKRMPRWSDLREQP
jgi:reductive dehalogenase